MAACRISVTDYNGRPVESVLVQKVWGVTPKEDEVFKAMVKKHPGNFYIFRNFTL